MSISRPELPDPPYEVYGTDYQAVLNGSFTGQEGETIALTTASATSLEAFGDWSASDVYIGRPYTFKYEFSPIYYKDAQKVSVPHYNMNIKNFNLFYDDSGYFKVTVTQNSGTSYNYQLSPTLGSQNMVVGNASITRGTFKFPVFGDSIKTRIGIESDSMFPCSFQGGAFEALMTTHSTHKTY